MNRQESDILNKIAEEPYINQRILAKASGHSLGNVNRSIKSLIEGGYLDEDIKLTKKAKKMIAEKTPKRAIILAAGFGMRMAPINTETSKGLLEVNGETLIERQIRQLQEVGIKEIYIVVGFMKEQYEYLIDEYDVTLIYNPEYSLKNNLHSLKLVEEHLENAYVIPCDAWCAINPFSDIELYSWYMISDIEDMNSSVRINRKFELAIVSDYAGGNRMIGISYLLKEEAQIIRERINQLCQNVRYDGAFWEETLYEKNKMILQARMVSANDVVEINTFEQLNDMEDDSNKLGTEAVRVITKVFEVEKDGIENISVLKKGMTNRSFLFECRGTKYIIRVPGIGTEKLINRKQEADVYQAIKGKGLCDDIVYINAKSGYKIARYIENAHECDAEDADDLKKCMTKLKAFHEMQLKVEHEFDIFERISYYESLWGEKTSVYRDYAQTKEKIFTLQRYINQHAKVKVLTHIDAVPDNFLSRKVGEGQEDIQLIDWEYAGMQDPHVDIAMFAIYALYEKKQVDNLIDIYFEGKCDDATRMKIYCYIAASGLLWSNWCEYKRNQGIDFGEYSLRQYRYAKEYYKIVKEDIKGEN